ncbi:hypothetical protein PHYBLDRAFT_139404 [Phycomyces blakesleeanus NRRL 1555(-)]|uniref:Uncharacterized protein n=1 Tax=Phycomyces blakesleeanus (strain ATCC 8743b / DSM 1359 / FGSC 10004 / NBRC 33097 / NRRL 1555) TaxID=763407 RepID=A0A167QAJ9_PHYB8|nr:hypothetical protein PHYBLDRAFT_139404 [Phycomyces blakesleeanus NRRL 1555(-)]OAD79374.1 hypothetical protein PHYBLDRAFT_139404 [Phycomyces blakesleeanus NRRL 1555(-)]|eukprot:XP_018297414.1 hypothetical protein PHYBLDRAFT_139404 [Phycomyces blakesleeanus NRRL 1555(-)]
MNINTNLTETEILAVYSLQFSFQKTIASDNDEDYEEVETKMRCLQHMREHLLNMHKTLIQMYNDIILAENNYMTDDFQTVCYLSSPMHITVAIVLWHLSNTHLKYKMISGIFDISQTAYYQFIERFLKAMICCFLNDTIK